MIKRILLTFYLVLVVFPLTIPYAFFIRKQHVGLLPMFRAVIETWWETLVTVWTDDEWAL